MSVAKLRKIQTQKDYSYLDNLSPYDRWQLERYGNILPNREPSPFFEGNEEDTWNASYYSLSTPAQ